MTSDQTARLQYTAERTNEWLVVGLEWLVLVSAHRTAAAHNAGLRDRLGISITGRAGLPEARISLRI